MSCSRNLSLVFLLATGMAIAVEAQSNTAPYTEGSVWSLSFIRVKPGMDDDYLNHLRANWKRVNDEAKRQGMVISYKVISASAANREDWDLLLMVEFKNMAALDGLRERLDPIQSRMVGQASEQRTRAQQRNEIREIIGGKLGREFILRDSLGAGRANR